MKCETFLNQIEQSLSGDLTGEPLQRQHEHRVECPKCSREWERAAQFTSMVRGFRADPDEALRMRVRRQLAERPIPDSMPMRFKETLMNQHKTLRIGLVSAIGVLAIAAGLMVLPRSAQASAHALWSKMLQASGEIKAVHIVNNYKLPDGQFGRSEIWTDGKNCRMDSPGGRVELVKDGEFKTVQLPTKEGQEIEIFDAVGVLNPKSFTLTEQIKTLGAGTEPIDLGMTQLNGKTMHAVAVMNRDNVQRHTFLVDPVTGLPSRKVDEERSATGWIEISFQDFEFLDRLDSDIFEQFVEGTILGEKTSANVNGQEQKAPNLEEEVFEKVAPSQTLRGN